MKRWNAVEMLDVGKKLFAKTHKRKYHAHHNSEIHYLAREVHEWLPKGLHSMIEGTYNPRCLKRYYFSDEVVDQPYLSDRIFQHILLMLRKKHQTPISAKLKWCSVRIMFFVHIC